VAFDISILNLSLSTATRIRDVLRQMRADGDLFFVAETRQLVFHVVPTPQRLSFYAAVFEALTALPRPEGDRVARIPKIPAELLRAAPETGIVEAATVGIVTCRWPGRIGHRGAALQKAVAHSQRQVPETTSQHRTL
jgi:hypothetical protein